MRKLTVVLLLLAAGVGIAYSAKAKHDEQCVMDVWFSVGLMKDGYLVELASVHSVGQTSTAVADNLGTTYWHMGTMAHGCTAVTPEEMKALYQAVSREHR